ncbi:MULTISPECIES: retron system putative HNH endonuclease [Pseudomonas]|uniref:retron system putative HNH endonuclease n=1 Tax=Pseudomonas TaxID=286 RepID=UPI000CD5ADDD|nr:MULTISPECIES: retron system putative HNH endonuclease [Pseudomonas]RBH52407.1 TIGR02646 family protein [Pseudomonas sp. MWU13-2860]
MIQAHANPPTTPDTASSRWKSFRRNKKPVLDTLLIEQYGLCCYSEIRPDRMGLGFHIEHVENKSQHPQRTFDYSNLAASALDSESDLQILTTQGTEAFGGHALGKSKGVNLTLFVSSHQADCSRFIAYLSDGRVVPADRLSPQDEDRARYTIKLLNLNSPYLQDLRQRWWEELETLIDEHLEDDMDLHCLAGVDLIPIGHGLSPLFSITRNLFGRIAEEVLEQGAPNLR